MSTAENPLQKPSVDEVLAFLDENNALIVHFSGPKGEETNPDLWFPKDLLAVNDGRSMSGVSACLVTARDTIDNCWGSIGLILAPTAPESIVVAWPNDYGTKKKCEGDRFWREVQNEPDIDRAALDASLSKRGAQSYNEWVMRDFKVIGVLAVAPYVVGLDQHAESAVGLEQLKALFPGLPIYTLRSSGFMREWPAPCVGVTSAEVYWQT